MIDLHCHILPYIDDGPRNWEDTISLARLLQAEGVTTVAATPHSYTMATPHEIRILARECQDRLVDEGLSIRVLPGTEILYGPNILHRLGEGSLQCYGKTNALLVETSAFIHPQKLDTCMRGLLDDGYRVILAHPEKLIAVNEDPNVLIPLVRQGILMQITASNLVGIHGEEKRRLCSKLLEHGLAQIIASDAHGTDGIRIPAMKQAFFEATKILGPAAKHMFQTIPAEIIEDQPLPSFHPRPIRWNY